MKKIISLIAALSMVSAFGISNVFAAETLTFSVSDPVEMSASDLEEYNTYLEEELGADTFELESGYKAYSIDLAVSGLPAKVETKAARVLAWEVLLTFDSAASLQATQPVYPVADTADFGMSETSFETANTLKTAFVIVPGWTSMKAGTGDDSLATIVVAVKEGATATVYDANLTVYVSSTKTEYGTGAGYFGKSLPAGTLSFGSSTPTPDPDPVIADINTTTGEVDFDYTNATLAPSSVLDGQTVKVFAEAFSGVTANKRFSITHTPSATTKKYGTSIGEYFGISGDGTVSGIVKVAILFPEGMNASDFEINMYDAE